MPWTGYPANTWDTEFLLYQRITKDASLRIEGSQAAGWFGNRYNSNIGTFQRVFDGFLSLSTEEPTATPTQLLSDLNTITVATIYEQNLKTDLRVFLELQINGTQSLTQQQTADLSNIADQCRYEGGFGVVLARLALEQPSIRSGECSIGLGGEGRNRSKNVNSIKALVFPNPAIAQAFQVQLDRTLQNGTVRLVDLQGRVVGTWNFTGDILDIHEDNLSPGIYMVEVLEQSHILNRIKLVISR